MQTSENFTYTVLKSSIWRNRVQNDPFFLKNQLINQLDGGELCDCQKLNAVDDSNDIGKRLVDSRDSKIIKFTTVKRFFWSAAAAWNW